VHSFAGRKLSRAEIEKTTKGGRKREKDEFEKCSYENWTKKASDGGDSLKEKGTG